MPDDAASLSVWGGFTVVEQMVPSVTVQCHAANLLALPNGDVLCAWFGGTQEGLHDIDIYLARLEAGATEWSAPSRLSGDRSRSEQNPVLFLAPKWRALALLDRAGGGSAGRRGRCERGYRTISVRAGATKQRSSSRTPVAGCSCGNHLSFARMVRGSSPCSGAVQLTANPGPAMTDHSAVRISSDDGRTWREVAVPSSEGMVHMCIVPTEPGGPFVALFRSRYADHIHRSRSDASGERWSAPEAIDLPNNNSSIQAINWSDHEIALVYNHSSAADATSRRGVALRRDRRW